jgi:hypothetical protein
MAHYKRGYPRSTASGHHVSQIAYRKHHGILPLRPRKFDDFLCGAPYGSAEYLEARLRYYEHRDWPDEFNMMANWPRWWDIMHHTRPARRKNRQTLNRVLREVVDPDGAFWCDGRKPHIYYW